MRQPCFFPPFHSIFINYNKFAAKLLFEVLALPAFYVYPAFGFMP